MANAAKRLPQRQTVYHYFRVWSKKGETGVSVLDKVLLKLLKQIRNKAVRLDRTSFAHKA